MKKIYLIIAAVSLFLVSCGDDEDKKNEERLTQPWVAVLFEKSECTIAANNTSIDLICNSQECSRLVLNSDNTYEYIETENGADITESGEWSVNGNTINFSYEDEGETIGYNRNFLIEDGILILTNIVSATGCVESTNYLPDDSSSE